MIEFTLFYLILAYGLGFRLQTFLIHDWWWPEFWYNESEDATVGFLWVISPVTLPFVLFIEILRWGFCYPIGRILTFLGKNARETHIV